MNELMLREMTDQPAIIESSLDTLRSQVAALPLGTRIERIVLTGSGDSLIAAEAAAPLFRASCDSEIMVASSLEASRYMRYRETDCQIVISVSGQVVRPVEAASRARAMGATVLAVVARDDSHLGSVSDGQLVMPPPLARNTPHSRDYTLTLVSLAVLLERIREQRLPQLDRLSELVSESLDLAFAAIPQAIVRSDELWCLGAGPDRATAMYGALKYWEAGLRAHWDDLEEFGHGSQLMARQGEGAVLIASGLGLDRALEMLPGMERMGLVPWIVSQDPVPDGIDGLRVPALGDPVWSPFVTCIPLQVLTYSTAQARGIDVTLPPGGAERGQLLEEIHIEWTRKSRLVVSM